MTPAARELPDFVRVVRRNRVALVHPDFMPDLADALLDGRGVSPAGLSGRSEMGLCTTHRGDALIRPYRRGGMIAKILGDRYVMRNRPQEELAIHCGAWRAGVPTVMPLGALWERSGIFVRGSFATLKADAVDLLTYLQGRPDPDPEVLAACGRAIRSMHRLGIWHADLQVKNILVRGKEALLIDFDGAGPILANASANLSRLRRSFSKRGLPVSAFEAIVDAYNRQD